MLFAKASKVIDPLKKTMNYKLYECASSVKSILGFHAQYSCNKIYLKQNREEL